MVTVLLYYSTRGQGYMVTVLQGYMVTVQQGYMVTVLHLWFFISSPELLGSQGELIGWP